MVDNITKVLDTLKKIYYDPDVNASSVSKLYARARQHPDLQTKTLKAVLTVDFVKKFLAKQGAYQRTKLFVKPREFSSIIAPRVGSNLQADLIIPFDFMML